MMTNRLTNSVYSEFRSNMHSPIIALGSMSGTSLDGLDLALVKFTPPSKKINRWRFSIISSNFISYSGTRWEDDLLKLIKPMLMSWIKYLETILNGSVLKPVNLLVHYHMTCQRYFAVMDIPLSIVQKMG